jgi:hypothetical protein
MNEALLLACDRQQIEAMIIIIIPEGGVLRNTTQFNNRVYFEGYTMKNECSDMETIGDR